MSSTDGGVGRGHKCKQDNGAGQATEEGQGRGVAWSLVGFGPLLGVHACRRVEGEVHRLREEGGQLEVHHHTRALLVGRRRGGLGRRKGLRRRRGAGSGSGSGRGQGVGRSSRVDDATPQERKRGRRVGRRSMSGVVELDDCGEALEIRQGRPGALVRRRRVERKQDGVEGRVERGWPRVEVSEAMAREARAQARAA